MSDEKEKVEEVQEQVQEPTPETKSEKASESAAVKAATKAKVKKEQGEVCTLPNGVSVRLLPVGAAVIRDAMTAIPEPVVPSVPHPNDPTKFIDNPSDPNYLTAMNEYKNKRDKASTNAMLLMGIELLSEIPPNDEWLPKLIFLGHITQKEVDEATPLHIELWYKKYMVANGFVYQRLAELMGVTEEMIEASINSFPSNQK